jgi:tetratricopeptide (TPR) repeat protein
VLSNYHVMRPAVGAEVVLSNGSVRAVLHVIAEDGVTTLSLTHSQNLNFAVPVSAVRQFLSTATYRPRAVGEGASTHHHLANTLAELQAALESPQISVVERNAIGILENAWIESKEAVRNTSSREEHIARVRCAISVAQASSKDLPKRFEHFMHYTIAESYELLAIAMAMPDDWMPTKDFPKRLRSSEHFKYAVRHYQAAIELEPGFAPAHAALASLNDLSGNWVDGLLASDALVKLMPRYARGLYVRARCYFKLNRSDEALCDMRAAIELSPLDAGCHYSLGLMLAKLGAYSESVVSCETALELGYEIPRKDVHFAIGRACWIGRDFEHAALEFTKAKANGRSPDLCDAVIALCRMGKPCPHWLAEIEWP